MTDQKYKLVPVEVTPKILEDAGTMDGYEGIAPDKDHAAWYKAAIAAAAPGPRHDLRDVAVALRQHLALFCGPDDAVANALFAKADAAIAASPELVCRWRFFEGGHDWQISCIDPGSAQNPYRSLYPTDCFCPHCGRKVKETNDEV